MVRGKRASFDDLVYIVGTLIGFALILLIVGTFVNNFNTKVQDSAVLETYGKESVNKVNDMYSGVIDNGFLLLTIGLCIASLIFAMLVIIHPVFFVFYVILLPVLIFVTGAISNIYLKAAEQPAMAEMASRLVFTSHILQFLPFIVGTMGLVLAIIMYKTWKNRQ